MTAVASADKCGLESDGHARAQLVMGGPGAASQIARHNGLIAFWLGAVRRKVREIVEQCAKVPTVVVLNATTQLVDTEVPLRRIGVGR